MARLKLLFIPKDNKGCGFYRIMVPANEIKKQDLADVILDGRWVPDEVGWADVIIAQRLCEQEAFEIIDKSHAMGKKIIYELDDYLQGVTPHNQAFDYWNPLGPNLGRALRLIQKCDAMQVSTPRLQKEYALWNKNIESLPNYLDSSLWDMPAWKAEHWEEFYRKKNDAIIRIG